MIKNQNHLGGICMILSVLFFSLMDVLRKITHEYDVGQVMFSRAIFGGIPIFFLIYSEYAKFCVDSVANIFRFLATPSGGENGAFNLNDVISGDDVIIIGTETPSIRQFRTSRFQKYIVYGVLLVRPGRDTPHKNLTLKKFKAKKKAPQ